MKISLITPTYNSSQSIQKCIESVISQSVLDFEHIIIDNHSSDNTLEKVKNIFSTNNLQSNLHIISEKDNGIAEAFNKGITKCSGEIIGILNSDDFYYNDKVFENVLIAFMDENIKFVHGDILFIDEVYGTNRRKPLRCNIRKAMPYNHPTMFLRKKVYDEVGIYDMFYKYAMDYDFICRMIKIYGDLDTISLYLSKEPVVVMNSGGVSWNYEKQTLYETRIAQIKNELWNFKSRFYYLIRLLRINIKVILSYLNLTSLIKLWRKLKWI